MKQGYRLIIVDTNGVLVSEFQLTENALAQPEAFVAALTQSIDDIEEEERSLLLGRRIAHPMAPLSR